MADFPSTSIAQTKSPSVKSGGSSACFRKSSSFTSLEQLFWLVGCSQEVVCSERIFSLDSIGKHTSSLNFIRFGGGIHFRLNFVVCGIHRFWLVHLEFLRFGFL